MMISPRRIAAAAALVAGLSSAASAKDCEVGAYPQALEAVHAWQARSGYGLAQAAVADVRLAFCVAAEDLLREKKADKAAIDAAAGKAVAEYLDRVADPAAQSRSLGSILKSAFGVSGFSRPQIKRLAMVTVAYTKDVDALAAGGDRFPKAKALLLPVGTVLVQALFKSNVVCSQSLELKAGVESKFSC
jgi:hypothetical protein